MPADSIDRAPIATSRDSQQYSTNRVLLPDPSARKQDHYFYRLRRACDSGSFVGVKVWASVETVYCTPGAVVSLLPSLASTHRRFHVGDCYDHGAGIANRGDAGPAEDAGQHGAFRDAGCVPPCVETDGPFAGQRNVSKAPLNMCSALFNFFLRGVQATFNASL